MPIYAVIDTNIIVSSLLTSHEDAATVKVMEKIFNGEIILLYSKEIMMEYEEVLKRKKFRFNKDDVDKLLDSLQNLGQLVIPVSSKETLPDMKDLPFYEVVISKKDVNAFLVTGNIKHFPKEKFILTANEFLQIFFR